MRASIMHRYTNSRESGGPSLVHSPADSSPATWPLPATPVDRLLTTEPRVVTATASPNSSALQNDSSIGTFGLPWLLDGSVVFDTWLPLPEDQTNKRNAPDDFDGPPDSRQKTIRLTHHGKESLAAYLEGEQDDAVCGEPHLDLGRKAGRFWCSCGKTYSTAFRLRAHITTLNNKATYACSTCGQQFTRDDVRQRHEDNTHKDKKVACPGCNKLFRTDYLRVHLANDSNIRCKLIVEALHIQTTHEPKLDMEEISSQYWDQRDQPNMGSSNDDMESSSTVPAGEPTPERSLENAQFAKSESARPIHRRTREPCDICREPLGPNEEDLIAHITFHNLNFMDKKFKCEECQINFMHQADLDRHLQAAAKGSCGFKFDHNNYYWNKVAKRHGWKDQVLCNGHHPPPHVKPFAPSDHELMQQKLWAWELRQIQAHRTTIARLLAERLAFTQPGHMSLTEHELSCMTRASRFSIASLNSVRSVPACLKYQDKIDIDQMASDLDNLVVDDNTASADVTARTAALKPRPESAIFTVPLNIAPRRSTSKRIPLWASAVSSRYLDRVNVLRKPQVSFSRVQNNEPSIRYCLDPPKGPMQAMQRRNAVAI